ncbi:MAG TPA: vWA domain-containing protein [Pirellulaceae bacterium]|nr:vWA domain-containing protein [Pirellulaceae bacterium]HMO93348.1 vWA domain-containing protein [Pirellulaceae bacterium]HMP70119.1 vWA domain-containing protein [Pirellulaceae bacterium]
MNFTVTTLGMSLCALVFGTLVNSFMQDTHVITKKGSNTTHVIILKQDSSKSPDAKPPFVGNRSAVDLAILLDTSNSMDGLISQAKSQLWTIVQQFAIAKRNGQTPILRVAVFEYGNTRLPASENYIRQVCGLTDDLDGVSQALFALTTQGGDEYCGAVIDEAITRLDWSKEPNCYKAIFIAGNEPFTQGPVDYRQACKRAIEHGIRVNTIHCGHRETGIATNWEDGAKLAEGEFMNIDQDVRVVQIECPQDKIIIELNGRLNKTYLWFGHDRQLYCENQIAQDTNAAQTGGLVQRAIIKGGASGGKVYLNRGRDLVDTLAANPEILTQLKVEDLPDEMQKMSDPEKLAHVQQMAKERTDVEQELAKLVREREEYLAKAQATGSLKTNTLGDAMIETVRKQLVASGFEFQDK